MTRTALTTIAAIAITAAAGTPAFAASQSDVELCRSAMVAQSNINMDDYRLRFEGQKNFRARTIFLKAISKSGGQSFEFECYIKRNQVTALKFDNILLAAK